jgi:DNA modification methylase
MSVGQNIFEKNKIYHGDCLEVMKQIPNKYIDQLKTK